MGALALHETYTKPTPKNRQCETKSPVRRTDGETAGVQSPYRQSAFAHTSNQTRTKGIPRIAAPWQQTESVASDFVFTE